LNALAIANLKQIYVECVIFKSNEHEEKGKKVEAVWKSRKWATRHFLLREGIAPNTES
jgi:hypothetical protein